METTVPFDPYDYAFHDDPYPTYARLRAEAPVYYNADKDFWALSRHADVRTAFRDAPRLSNSWGVSLDPAAYGPDAHMAMSFLALDDPKHMRIRKLVSKGFTPNRVHQQTERITELARQHWDRCLEMGEFDYVSDFAGLLPMDVVSELLVVPEADRARLRQLSDDLIHRDEGVFDVPPAAVDAYFALAQYYSDLIDDRRANPGSDMVSVLIDAEVAGDELAGEQAGEPTRLTTDEIIGFLILMIVAGNETTTKLLANAIYWASVNPDELAKPLNDPQAVPAWTEETLRYDNSTQMVLRRVLEDVEYGGYTIPAGQRVLLLLGSANRDDDVFDDPDVYQIGRDSSQALTSFGLGTHFCLGAHLARLEANVALTEIVKSVSTIELDLDNAVRVHSVNVRGFASLPMTVTAR
ncbi:cytochrome P450 [Williamsia sp. M5A3_1d]